MYLYVLIIESSLSNTATHKKSNLHKRYGMIPFMCKVNHMKLCTKMYLCLEVRKTKKPIQDWERKQGRGEESELLYLI